MPSLKDVQTKITGVRKTSQITKAMNMVASAKLRGAQQRIEDFRPYAEKFQFAMGNMAGSVDPAQYPLMAAREVRKVEIVVVSSDRGLCGSFNAHIFKMADKEIARVESEGKEVSLVCVGKKAAAYFKKSGKIRKKYTDLMAHFQMFNAREIARDVAENFLAGESDNVQMIYSRFVSVAVQRPTVSTLLPVSAEVSEGESSEAAVAQDYIYEPSAEEIMDVLLPLYMNVTVYRSMLEVSASEHAARMAAMDNATNACGDIVHNLTLIYNKARQSGITAELMDIVGGAEALKG